MTLNKMSECKTWNKTNEMKVIEIEFYGDLDNIIRGLVIKGYRLSINIFTRVHKIEITKEGKKERYEKMREK